MDMTALFKLSYGMYIVTTSGNEGKSNGQIANTIFQITAEPSVLSISVHKQNYTNQLIKESNKVNISILGTDATFDMIGRFGFRSGRDFDKLAGIDTVMGENGVPVVIQNCCSYLECDVIGVTDNGTHEVYNCLLKNAVVLDASIEPMTYKYYHEVVKGKSPKTAPTYVKL